MISYYNINQFIIILLNDNPYIIRLVIKKYLNV